MAELEDLADRQHGQLSHRQIRQVVTQGALRRRLQRGVYRRTGTRVVRVGGAPLTELARCQAALLSIGPPAMIGCYSAARLHGIGRFRAQAQVWVSVPYQRCPRCRPETRISRTRTWERRHSVTIDGLTVSSLADVMLDLAPRCDIDTLTSAGEDALRSGLDLADLLSRIGTRTPGGRTLRRVLGRLRQSPRSALERRLVPALVAAGLGHFRQNMIIESGIGEIDILYEVERVVVELDGWAYHHDAAAFQRDRTKQNRLITELGYTVLRFTHADVYNRLPSVIAQIGAALHNRRPHSA